LLFPYSYIGIGLTPPAILRSTISATLLAGEEPPWASLAEETEPSEPPASWGRIDNWLNAAAADMLQRAMRAEEKEEEEAAEAVAGGGGAPTSAELLSLCSSRRCLPSAAGGARQIRQLQVHPKSSPRRSTAAAGRVGRSTRRSTKTAKGSKGGSSGGDGGGGDGGGDGGGGDGGGDGGRPDTSSAQQRTARSAVVGSQL